MITHSLIVGALLLFSMSVHAGVMAMDGISVAANPAGTVTNSNAVLHRDAGLQQGGGNGKDVMEAPVETECVERRNCTVPRVETIRDLLVINANASGAGPLILILLILIASFSYLRRAQFTK